MVTSVYFVSRSKTLSISETPKGLTPICSKIRFSKFSYVGMSFFIFKYFVLFNTFDQLSVFYTYGTIHSYGMKNILLIRLAKSI